MKYIVYQNNRGYFVSYASDLRSKLSGKVDGYSDKWYSAKRYTSLGPAFGRLPLILNKTIKSRDDFFKINKLDKSVRRHDLISEILDDTQPHDPVFIFENGYIEMVDEGSDLCRMNASEHILEYVDKFIMTNKKRKVVNTNCYIDNEISDEDFFGFKPKDET